MGTVSRLIKKQPTFIKQVYYNIVPFRYRYGKAFGETIDFLKEVDKWGYSLTREYQLDKLREVLKYCQLNVPYYGKLFAEHEFNPNIQGFKDLRKLPYLTKDIVNDNLESLVSQTSRPPFIKFKTSGSTGRRFEFLGDDSMYKVEAAYITRSFNSHGSDLYNDWSVWIRRYSPAAGDKLIKVDYELKRIYMSAFHLNDETIAEYVEAINHSKAKILVSYPSTAYWLSCLLEKHNLKLPHVTAIHGASEKCLNTWGSKINEVFGVPLKMHYGQIEKVAFAYQSSVGQNYHESLTYSFMELGENNVVVGTSFINNTMPFIRYITNDIITPVDVPDLGYSSPITIGEIDGRVDDMLVSETDCRIPAVNFYTVMYNFETVKMFKFHQKENKDVTLFIVPMDHMEDNVIEKIKSSVLQRIGNLNLAISVVKEIPRDPSSGKMRCVVTEIK